MLHKEGDIIMLLCLKITIVSYKDCNYGSNLEQFVAVKGKCDSDILLINKRLESE